MVRPLSAVEHAFWLANLSANNHIVYAAELEGTATPREWRDAFDTLQRRHPVLRVRIPATAGGWPYLEFVHGRPIPVRHAVDAIWDSAGIAHEWLNETLAHELQQPVDSGTAPLMRAVIASDRGRSVVIVAVSHVLYDGISVARCIGDLVRVLNGEQLDVLPFPRSMNHVLGVPDAVAPREAVSLEGVSYPQQSPPAVHCMKLPRQLSGELRQRARDEQTTVHGALCSAFVMAGRSSIQRWRGKSIDLRCPVDVRRLWGGDGEFGFFATGGKATLPPGAHSSLWDLARETLRLLDPTGAREGAKEQVRQFTVHLTEGMDAQGVMRLADDRGMPDLVVTNIGVVHDTRPVGRFGLRGLWGPLVRARRPEGLAIAVASVDDCIHLAMMSAAPFPSFLENARALLVQACE